MKDTAEAIKSIAHANRDEARDEQIEKLHRLNCECYKLMERMSEAIAEVVSGEPGRPGREAANLILAEALYGPAPSFWKRFRAWLFEKDPVFFLARRRRRRMSDIIACVLLTAVLLSGCGIKIPQPPTTDPPVVVKPPVNPPSAECTGPNQCGCSVQQTEGVYKHVCCTPWLSGGIMLADDPKECPKPPTEPEPPVVTPSAACIKPGSDWQIQTRAEAPDNALINEVMQSIRPECAISSRCKINMDRMAFMGKVISGLNAKGKCAGYQVENGDKVAVGTQADNWTYHVVSTGEMLVAWQPSKSEPPDHWIATAPPAPTCPPVTRIDLALKMYAQRSVDATPKATGLENCTALGFTDRRECPLGVEGTAGREACETAAGPWTWTLDGVPCAAPSCWSLSGNPLLYASPAPGRLTVCAANGFCSSVVLP